MAIAKWMQFGTPQATAAESTKPDPVPPVSSADAKKFGLENVCRRPSFTFLSAHPPSFLAVWQHLVSLAPYTISSQNQRPSLSSYANSVLQALYFCTPFRELLLQAVDHSASQSVPVPPPASVPPPPPPQPTAPWPKPQRKHSTAGQTSDPPTANGSAHHYPPIPSSPPTLVSALRSLFLYISKHPEDKGIVAPRAFIDKLKEVNELFRSTMHQDAHEFLNYLLNKVVEEVEEERRRQPAGTPIPAEDRECCLPPSSCVADRPFSVKLDRHSCFATDHPLHHVHINLSTSRGNPRSQALRGHPDQRDALSDM